MANFSKLVITEDGKKLLNDAFTSGKKVEFTNASASEMSFQEETLHTLSALSEIKQTVPIHNITKDNDVIEMMVVFDNDALSAGYYLRTLGVYVMLDEGEEVLFAVAKEQTENLFIPAGEVAVSGVNMKLKIQLENADAVQLVVDRAGVATLGDVLSVSDDLATHAQNKNNPHGVTKSQIGLGNVDNTADTEKPVSTAQQTALDSYYQQSTGYTDQKIADLINGAPETLDTLKEVADAIEENETVVEALDNAIGKKANQAELDGHIINETIHITEYERENWNKITQIEDDIDSLSSDLIDESAKVGLLTSLTTSVKTSIVNAINSLVSALNTHKTSGDHDGRYYTETEINNLISGFPNIYAYSSSGGTLEKINGLLYATKTLTFSSGTATWNISTLKPGSHPIVNVLSAFIDSGSSTYVINSLSYSSSTGIITARCLKVSDGSAFTGSVTVTFIMSY